MMVPIQSIRYATDAALSADKVQRFAHAMDWDHRIPPVTLYAMPDGSYVLRDGRHRLRAAILSGYKFINAEVIGQR